MGGRSIEALEFGRGTCSDQLHLRSVEGALPHEVGEFGATGIEAVDQSAPGAVRHRNQRQCSADVCVIGGNRLGNPRADITNVAWTDPRWLAHHGACDGLLAIPIRMVERIDHRGGCRNADEFGVGAVAKCGDCVIGPCACEPARVAAYAVKNLDRIRREFRCCAVGSFDGVGRKGAPTCQVENVRASVAALEPSCPSLFTRQPIAGFDEGSASRLDRISHYLCRVAFHRRSLSRRVHAPLEGMYAGVSHSGSLARRTGMDEHVKAAKHGSPDVVVIGAGLAGLTAAAIVARSGRSVVVREKRGAIGGDARSVNREGFTFNQGPHALYRGGPAERVLTGLGVKLRGGKPPVRGCLVFDGRTEIAPTGPVSLLRTGALGPKDKIDVGKVFGVLPRLTPAKFASSTVNEWVASVTKSDRSAQLLHAIVRLATYTNQPDVMSADVAISQLQSALGPGVLYLDGGWQSLVDQLTATPGVLIVTEDVSSELPDARAVIIAAGGPATASTLTGTHSAVAELAPQGQFHAAAVQYLAANDEPDADGLMAFTRYAGVSDDDVIVSRRLHRMTPVSSLPLASMGGMAGRPRTTDSGQDNVFLAGDWVGPTGFLTDAPIASAEAAAQAALSRLDARGQR